MLPLQWSLDGTLYYVAHYNCEASCIRVDQLCLFKIIVFGKLIDLPTFSIDLNLGIAMHFCCFLINLLLMARFFFSAGAYVCKVIVK